MTVKNKKRNNKVAKSKPKKVSRSKKQSLFSRAASTLKHSRKNQLVAAFVLLFATFGVYQLFFAEAAYKPWNPASATGKATYYCPPGCPTYDGKGALDKGYCAAWRWGSAYHGDPHTLEVTNTANGKKITCKVNDQGPYNEFDNRIIDLRKGDFITLAGSLSVGVINVSVKCVAGSGCASNPQPSSCPDKKGDYSGSHSTLKPGSTNKTCVHHLQYMIDLIGKYDNKPTEYAVTYADTYDSTTKSGVISYQKRKGLTANGTVDSTTWKSLHGACKYINDHPKRTSSGGLYRCVT